MLRQIAGRRQSNGMRADPANNRRAFLRTLAGSTALLLAPRSAHADAALITRVVPSTGEALPVVGLGSWITFNVGDDRAARDECADVMRAFFAAGGRMIDSSPMYGSSQQVIGYGLHKLGVPAALFAADKVWIGSGARGAAQIEESRSHWNVRRFDLLQVHNLLAWKEHLPTLFGMKASGQLRYVGITTSEGRRHGEMEKIMRDHRLDFIQLTYNPQDREAEQRLLPLARERGIAVLVNRPFQEGDLLKKLRRQALPAWASEIDCTSWAQLVLKFIVSHPAVTCAIPATTQASHVRENMIAGSGRMPDEALRHRIGQLFSKL